MRCLEHCVGQCHRCARSGALLPFCFFSLADAATAWEPCEQARDLTNVEPTVPAQAEKLNVPFVHLTQRSTYCKRAARADGNSLHRTSRPSSAVYVFPLLRLNSSIHSAALALGTTLTLTNPSTTSTFPLPSSFSRLKFFPALIRPPVTVSI